MEPHSMIEIAASVIVTVIAALTLRAVKGFDSSLASIAEKQEALRDQDTKNQIALAELRVRVTALEMAAKKE